jgi:hypothetical protein
MNKIFFLIIVIILSVIIIYFIFRNIHVIDQKKDMLKHMNAINTIEKKLLKKNEKIIFQDVKISIYEFVVNRLSGKYRLSNKDIILLNPNFIFISNQLLDELLKLYSIYEIYSIISTDPYDIYNNLLEKQINENQLLMDQQIAGIDYISYKFPEKDPSDIVKYIKRNSNIFKIKEIPFKNNKPDFTQEQEKILKNFKS